MLNGYITSFTDNSQTQGTILSLDGLTTYNFYNLNNPFKHKNKLWLYSLVTFESINDPFTGNNMAVNIFMPYTPPIASCTNFDKVILSWPLTLSGWASPNMPVYVWVKDMRQNMFGYLLQADGQGNLTITCDSIPFLKKYFGNIEIFLTADYARMIPLTKGTLQSILVLVSGNNIPSVSSNSIGLDLFVDNFNPQVGNYTTNGSASLTVTPGNMAIAGGNGLFSSNIILNDVIWNGNNWYIDSEMKFTNTNGGQYGTCFGLSSVNGGQLQNVYAGIYHFGSNNTGQISIFGSNPAGGQINSSPLVSLEINAGDVIRTTLYFLESRLVVKVTNTSLPGNPFAVASYDYDYNVGLSSNLYKPNVGKVFVLAPQSTVNISYIKFGTQYVVGIDRLAQGDSISSGYFQQTEYQRFLSQYSALSGKSVAIMAGAGDTALLNSNATALALYQKILPKRVLIFNGTNDIANGASASTTIGYINAQIAFWNSNGIALSNIFVAEAIPRDGVSMTAYNSAINALTGVTIVQWYSLMEDPSNPGNILPAYTNETPGAAIHPNAAGAVVMANKLITIGF